MILGILTLLLFKKNLSRFLDRAERIGVKGIEAGQPTKQLGESTQASGATALFRLFDNTLLRERETFIDKRLKEDNVDPSDRERVLMRFLAAASIRLEFEETYRLILGSQIGVLELLNTVASGLNVERLRINYERAAERDSDVYKVFSFESWFSFLVQKSLVFMNNEGTVSITLEGKEFLKYLVQMGYSLYKMY
ncbi:MAG: hypothetical protein M3430_01565 [Acidobacteriota bacterium]|nr:hypothetical protein [Acidobacteriota bacterium]